jgi:hypothetical protein
MTDLSSDLEETQSTVNSISAAEIKVHNEMVLQDLISEEGEGESPSFQKTLWVILSKTYHNYIDFLRME